MPQYNKCTSSILWLSRDFRR